MELKYEPLQKEDVKRAVEGRGPVRPPAHMHIWPGEGLREHHGEEAVAEVFAPYPSDVVNGGIVQPGAWEAPEGFSDDYRWAWHDRSKTPRQAGGRDSGGGILYEWEHFDQFMDSFPQANDPRIYDGLRDAAANANGRYVMALAWNNFYERLWGLRGMQNLLMDFHLHKERMHALCEALKDLVLDYVEGAAQCGADGFFTSNDLGHQTGLMMSPDTFREFLKPLHAEVAAACHRCGMHYWMHSCGDLTDILEDMVEVGLDCLHPLQYGAMDWDQSARLIDGRMTAWAGVDVQHILQEETPEGVREHVRDLIDTFHVPGEGHCVVAAGNGITGATPLENIDAFLD
jgi:uroporphyrinogen decarboxylase